MNQPRLEHQVIKIKQLVEDYRSGRLVIPEFQRDYVWRKSRAPRLIDSIYRGFPISSLLVWQTTEATKARRSEPYPRKSSVMNWLIDGQQRVTTLARVLDGEQGIDVRFNPLENRFALSNAALRSDPNWYRLADICDEAGYRQLRRTLGDVGNADKREQAFDRVRGILDYEIPLIRMVDHGFESAVDAFTRINTLGVRLRKQDIESARVSAQHSGFIVDEVTPFLEKIRAQGFTRLNIMHLFRACAFIAKPDGRNRTPLHELSRSEVMDAWKRTEKATNDVLGLVRSELGLVNMDILWSGALFVPLIAVCATSTPRSRDSKGLIGWLSLAALHHRYSGSSDTALDKDLRACRSNNPVGSLLSNLRELRQRLTALPGDFGGAIMDRSGLLAV